jgi:hypothetical protein
LPGFVDGFPLDSAALAKSLQDVGAAAKGVGSAVEGGVTYSWPGHIQLAGSHTGLDHIQLYVHTLARSTSPVATVYMYRHSRSAVVHPIS